MSDQHRIAREFFYKERQAKRGRQSLGRRLDVALSEARTLSEVGSPSLERQSRNAENEQVGPKDGTGLLLSPERDSAYNSFSRRVAILIRSLEAEVDTHKFGVGVVGADPNEQTIEERDRRLLKWTAEGLSPEEISFLDAGQGGVRAIKKALERLKDA